MFGLNVLGLICNVKLISFQQFSIQLYFLPFLRFIFSFSFLLRVLVYFTGVHKDLNFQLIVTIFILLGKSNT